MARLWILAIVVVTCGALPAAWAGDAASPETVAPASRPATRATTSSTPCTLPVTFMVIEEEVAKPTSAFVEDPNLRVLGMSPRQMLWVGSIACVVIMVLGTIVTIRLSKKAAG
jgi:hypothetical protein